MDQVEYVGFWLRVWASIIDTVLILIVCLPLVHWIYGAEYWASTRLIQGPADFLITWVAPAIAVLLFWYY
ncbi:MAG: RDD family protein, partial [Woeseiaceae bacterium]